MPNFVDNNTSLPSQKTDIVPIPAGGSANNYMAANDYNKLAGAAQDIRTVILRETSIMSYGADPTGATSSNAALSAAISALTGGGIIHFPVGIYEISGAISVPANIQLQFDSSVISIPGTSPLLG